MRHAAWMLSGALAACMPVPSEPPGPGAPLAVGQERVVELYAIRFDVTNFAQAVDKQMVLEMPKTVRDNLWLYNLDLTGKSGTPRLLDNSLSQIRTHSLDDPALSQAEINMIRLLNMTPDTADLRGTNMEELLSLAPKVGFAAPEVLARVAGVQPDDPFLTDTALTRAMLEGVIASHPNAQQRRGRATPEHPDGRIPVPLGFLPVTLEDAATDMRSVAERFGPYDQDGRYHPGFMVGVVRSELLSDDFQMVIKASTNALPFKGIDLTNADVGSVASIGKDAGQLFDFSDPEWLRIEGLSEDLAVEEMTFQIVEHPEYLDAGRGPVPAPWGNSPVWQAPVWSLERVVAAATMEMFQDHSFYEEYYLGEKEAPLFSVSVADGWLEILTKAGLGSPPEPLYMWDFIGQVQQVRLHDGPDPNHPEVGALPEGEANVRFTLHDVELGITIDQIKSAIRRNLEEDPSGLISAAAQILDQSGGAPDFYYYRPRASSTGSPPVDWLYYIVADDIPLDDAGDPVRDPTAYVRPGFFADPDLSQKVSEAIAIDGDTTHEKVRVEQGNVLFCGDDTDAVYQLQVLKKPSQARIRLRVTRVR